MSSKSRNDITLASDTEGTYISLGFGRMPEALYYLKAGDAILKHLKHLEQPEARQETTYYYMAARESGLFVLSDKPGYSFWSKERQHWEYYSQPQAGCKPMQIDRQGRNLTVECNGTTYQSSDFGASWNSKGA